MNILNKLTIKNLKLNKKRTIGTMIGIILSVALICAVSNMVSTFRETLIQNAISKTGYYHLNILNANNDDIKKLELNKDIENIYQLYNLGYAKYNTNDKYYPYIEVNSLNKNEFGKLEYRLIEGRYPENNNEIVISNKIKLKSNYKLGDIITLNIGERKTSDGYDLNNDNPYNEDNKEVLVNTQKKSYTIVGIINKSMVDNEYYGITTEEVTNKISAYIILKNPKEYKESILQILGVKTFDDIDNPYIIQELNYKFYLNDELLRWEVAKFSDLTLSMILTVASVVIVIIIFTSVFCIRNSFAISTTERMKMYGMLASIGATKKQIKKSIISEGVILGFIAIPIGIVCGILAVFILIKVVNLLIGDFLFENIYGLVFKISVLSIILSAVLGFVTIYFSAISSAIKASKVSPIENLRSSNEVKINSKKLHTPKIIKSIFKIGGVLAYKNLKRSKKKYRTTVISLTVSIFVFISMFAFIEEGFKQGENYYQDYDYNMQVNLNSKSSKDEIQKIRNLNSVNKSYLTYQTYNGLKITDIAKINMFDDNTKMDYDNNGYIRLSVILLEDTTFRDFANKINGNYEELKDKGILYDTYKFYTKKDEDKKEKIYEVRQYKFKKGDKIETNFTNEEQKVNIEIGKVSTTPPYGMESVYYTGGILTLNEKYFSNFKYRPYQLLIDSDNNEQLEKEIKEIDQDLRTFDIEEETQNSKAMILVISIFLYGFIAVISLIGVTNIFNTITSNMELRQKEFAMLKSIGMTKKEFNKMINLETLFYSTKSLVYGTILGIIGAFIVHKAFSENIETIFKIPYKAIIISIIFVFIIVYIIMKYSINKINKQNTIETIRKENI